MAKYRVDYQATVVTYRILEADSPEEAEAIVKDDGLMPDDLDNAAQGDDIDVWEVTEQEDA